MAVTGTFLLSGTLPPRGRLSDALERNTCSHLRAEPWGQGARRTGRLAGAGAEHGHGSVLGPVVGGWPVPPTGSGWLHARAAFQAAGWAAGSQPSARGERGGLSIKVPTTQVQATGRSLNTNGFCG